MGFQALRVRCNFGSNHRRNSSYYDILDFQNDLISNRWDARALFPAAPHVVLGGVAVGNASVAVRAVAIVNGARVGAQTV